MRFYCGGRRGASHVIVANLIRHWFSKIIKREEGGEGKNKKGEKEKSCSFSLPGAGGSAQSRLGNPAPSPSPTVPQTCTFRPSAHSRGSVYICLFQSRNKINLLFLNVITRYSGSSPFASGCRFRFVLA